MRRRKDLKMILTQAVPSECRVKPGIGAAVQGKCDC